MQRRKRKRKRRALANTVAASANSDRNRAADTCKITNKPRPLSAQGAQRCETCLVLRAITALLDVPDTWERLGAGKAGNCYLETRNFS